IEMRVERDRPPTIEVLLDDFTCTIAARRGDDAQRLGTWLGGSFDACSEALQKRDCLGARSRVVRTHPDRRRPRSWWLGGWRLDAPAILVGVPPSPRLAAIEATGNPQLENWLRRVHRLAVELAPKAVHHGDGDVRADEVKQRERSHAHADRFGH